MDEQGPITPAMLEPGKIYAFTDADWKTPEDVTLLGTTRVRRFIELRLVNGRTFAWVERGDGTAHLLLVAGLATACELPSFDADPSA